MRETTYSFARNLLNNEQIKELNSEIKKYSIKGEDSPATGAKKTSNIMMVPLGPIHRFLIPFIDFCQTANNNNFGFDLFQLTSQKIINYNFYEPGSEYSWHVDAESRSPIRDIKLTALLNISEEQCQGGDLLLFKGKEVVCKEFNTPGSAVVFPSFTNHKVTKLESGTRATLAIWMWGPKFR